MQFVWFPLVSSAAFPFGCLITLGLSLWYYTLGMTTYLASQISKECCMIKLSDDMFRGYMNFFLHSSILWHIYYYYLNKHEIITTSIKNLRFYFKNLLFLFMIILPLDICYVLMPWLIRWTWVIVWWRTCLSCRGLRDTVRTLIGFIPDFLDIAVTKLFFSWHEIIPQVVNEYYCNPKLELFN